MSFVKNEFCYTNFNYDCKKRDCDPSSQKEENAGQIVHAQFGLAIDFELSQLVQATIWPRPKLFLPIVQQAHLTQVYMILVNFVRNCIDLERFVLNKTI